MGSQYSYTYVGGIKRWKAAECAITRVWPVILVVVVERVKGELATIIRSVS